MRTLCLIALAALVAWASIGCGCNETIPRGDDKPPFDRKGTPKPPSG